MSRVIYKPGLLRPKKSRCPRCKVEFKEGDEIIMREGYWWYHPNCAREVTEAKVVAEIAAAAPAKDGWAHQGRVIRKGGGL